MNKKNIGEILIVTMLSLSSLAQAKEALRVQVPAVFDEQTPIEPSVKAECAVDRILGNHVFQKVADKYPGTLQVTDPAKMEKGRVLKLTVLSVQGIGGGGWTGPKAVTVRADLVQDGEVVQTVVKREHSRGGVFGGMRGTCSILEIVAESLGRQIATWLVSQDSSGSTGQSVPAAKIDQNVQTKQITEATDDVKPKSEAKPE
ncbi:hypothetical protein hmeg3_09240 [Herbaspirillum sp. meg3]|uniref:hypothetical protein n=1 Tax=Herbaspirillum sp. meg3 TaxID=2025949 RepID=UPI000B985549|nr:hypothetical protein [Herbaspirillum sp. meg3]ASU38464.1 hypothetical protein hmeg3_09240 [Herbaspirillum sp. meg3]